MVISAPCGTSRMASPCRCWLTQLGNWTTQGWTGQPDWESVLVRALSSSGGPSTRPLCMVSPTGYLDFLQGSSGLPRTSKSKLPDLKAPTWKWHSMASIAFYWLQGVTGSAQPSCGRELGATQGCKYREVCSTGNHLWRPATTFRKWHCLIRLVFKKNTSS